MKLIVGNLKMNLNYNEIEDYVDYFMNKHYSNVFFAPSSIYFSKFIDGGLNCVSQDVSPFEKGAYTGDISCMQLKSMGISYSIVGHSERRQNYDDGKWVNAKIKGLLKNDMRAILCIGETYENRKSEKTFEILKKELEEALKDVEIKDLEKIIIAYEPVWSIGTGVIPTTDEIKEVAMFIKKYVKDTFQYEIRVLYGGSVNNNYIKSLEKIDNIDGYLVGGCSLNCEEFDNLINSIN